jgi:hypothetical protein
MLLAPAFADPSLVAAAPLERAASSPAMRRLSADDALRALDHLDLPAGWSSSDGEDSGSCSLGLMARSAPAATGLASHTHARRNGGRAHASSPKPAKGGKQPREQGGGGGRRGRQQQYLPAGGTPPRHGSSLSRGSSLDAYGHSPAASVDVPHRLLQLSGSTTPSSTPPSGEAHLLRRRHAPPASSASSSSSSASGPQQDAAAAPAAPSERLLALLQQHCLADSDLVPSQLALHHFCAIKQLCRQFHAGPGLDLPALAAAALAGRYAEADWLPSRGALPIGRFMCAACRRFIITGSVHMHMGLPTHWAAVKAAVNAAEAGAGGACEAGGLVALAGELAECLRQSYSSLEALQQQARRVAEFWAAGGEQEVSPLAAAGLLELVDTAREGFARCLQLQGRLEALLLEPAHACYGAGEAGPAAGDEKGRGGEEAGEEGEGEVASCGEGGDGP